MQSSLCPFPREETHSAHLFGDLTSATRASKGCLIGVAVDVVDVCTEGYHCCQPLRPSNRSLSNFFGQGPHTILPCLSLSLSLRWAKIVSRNAGLISKAPSSKAVLKLDISLMYRIIRLYVSRSGATRRLEPCLCASFVARLRSPRDEGNF